MKNGPFKCTNRQEQIIELLNNNGSMKATELADYFSVSRETIRRDLNTLSENGSIKKDLGERSL